MWERWRKRKDWFIFEYLSEEEAIKAFELFANHGLPVILSQDINYPPRFYLVAVYGSDDEVTKAGRERPTANEGYVGRERMLELLRVSLIYKAKNIPIRDPDRSLDEVLNFIRRTIRYSELYEV